MSRGWRAAARAGSCLKPLTRRYWPSAASSGLPPKPWRVADSCRSLAVVGTLMPLGSGTGSGCPVVSGSLLSALGEDLFVGDGWEHLAAAVAPLVVVGV